MQDRQIMIKELADEEAIHHGSVHSIMKEDLGFKRISVKFMPKQLMIEQITQDSWRLQDYK